MEVPLEFLIYCSISKRFAVSGKPLVFSTRSGIFYGWWRCWRSVTSPNMVAILAAILWECQSCENSENNFFCARHVKITLYHFIHKLYFYSRKKIIHFHPKMAWPPATYDVISRNHSNFSQITQIISTVRTTEIELLFSTPRKIKDFRAVEWLGMGGFVCSLFLCSVYSATQLFIN